MGNFEKVVVLLILLVCAIVLGISLRSPEPAVASTGLPAGDALSELAGTQAGQLGPPRQLDDAAPRETAPDGRSDRGSFEPLRAPRPADGATAERSESTALRTTPATAEPPTLLSLVDTGDDRELALVRADGLLETVSPDYMVYTCRPGDTWRTLAAFYYGAADQADLLRNANEGLDAPASGEPILVPKFDLALEGPGRAPVQPREEPEYRVYTVQSGDTLSGISSKMYGTASRWMQIFDANRDVLASADAVAVGVKLRIP